MIKEIYIRDFCEYIDLVQNETMDFENIFSFNKSIENVIELNKKQNDIISEIKSWKKFYLNSLRRKDYLKVSFRDFEPLLTSGEIAEFITNKLQYFDSKTGEFIGWKLVFDKTLRKYLNNFTETRDVYRSFRLLEKLYLNVKKITGIDLLNADFLDLKKFVLNAGNKLNALDLRGFIEKSMPSNLFNKIKNKTNRKTFIDFIFESITDYDLFELDYKKFGGIRQRLEERFKEFVQRGIFKLKEDRKIEATDVFNIAYRMFEDIKTDFINNKNVFKFNFTNSLVRAINRQLSPFDFGSNVRNMLRSYGREAFRSGVLNLGLEPDDFKPVENFLISKMNKYVGYYITNLTTKVFTGLIDVGKALVTGDSWANRILERFFEYGRLVADRNGLYEWVYGDTKHCESCLKANGQRHKLRHWYEAGILPKNNGHKNIICGGYHCQCKLIKVTGESRGRLDRIPLAA